MTVGQCILTSACDLITCEQVRRYLPTNIQSMLGSCRAKCCKLGECYTLPNDGDEVLQLPGSTPALPQRPLEYPQFEESHDDLNLLLLTDDETNKSEGKKTS